MLHNPIEPWCTARIDFATTITTDPYSIGASNWLSPAQMFVRTG
jgi:hypothetical protein